MNICKECACLDCLNAEDCLMNNQCGDNCKPIKACECEGFAADLIYMATVKIDENCATYGMASDIP